MFGWRGRQILAAAALAALAFAGMAAAATLNSSSSASSLVDCSSRAAITHVQVTVSGGTAQASFGVAPGCTGIQVSLASYRASSAKAGFPQTFNDSSTGVFSAGGPFTLSAAVASCFFQVDLVLGNVITHLVSTGNQAADIANGTLYGPRKLKVVAGGSESCGNTPPPPPVEKPISVFVECVTDHSETFDATFGYASENAGAFTIAAGGSRNAFSPLPADRGQVSTFQPGTHADVFSVSGVGNGTTLVWSVTLGGQTRTASVSASFETKCETTPPPTTTGTTTGTTSTASTTTTGASTAGTTTTASSGVDVAVTKTAGSPTVAVGSNVTFTGKVVNNGPGTATNVSFIDTLPTGLTLVSATTTQGSCGSSVPLTCNLGTLTAGAGATVTIVTRAGVPGVLVNHATVTETQPDTNLANNTAAATVTAQGAFKPPTTKKTPSKKKAPKHAAVRGTKTVAKAGTKPAFTG